jgi:hypothetical protein
MPKGDARPKNDTPGKRDARRRGLTYFSEATKKSTGDLLKRPKFMMGNSVPKKPKKTIYPNKKK